MKAITTVSEVIAAVRKLATDWPDAIYDMGDLGSCLYDAGNVSNGPPGAVGCIFGQAGVSLGIMDRFPVGDQGGVGIATLFADYLEVATTGDEQDWMKMVQEAQDTSSSWGDAVANADELVGRVHYPKSGELCEACGLTYQGGIHEVREDGRFPTGGHYFEDDAQPPGD